MADAIRMFRMEDAPEAFAQAQAIRRAVFVQEQGVPESDEWDDYDAQAWHWLAVRDGQMVGTARMVAYQEGCQMRPVAKIGRVAVLQAYRGQGIASELMRAALAQAHADGFDQALVDAQVEVAPFYARWQFVAEGEPFMDAGLLHVRMRCVFP